MFSLFVVTVVAVFVTVWLIAAPIGRTDIAVQSTLIVGAITLVASVVVWFLYTRVLHQD
jgi:hypothetical protein